MDGCEARPTREHDCGPSLSQIASDLGEVETPFCTRAVYARCAIRGAIAEGGQSLFFDGADCPSRMARVEQVPARVCRPLRRLSAPPMCGGGRPALTARASTPQRRRPLGGR